MKKTIINLLTINSFILFSLSSSMAQTAPSLGIASGYALYTSAGAFGNTGTTDITGNIGNGAGGAPTGDDVNVTGEEHFGDVQGLATMAAVAAAYAQLLDPVTNTCGTTLTSPIGSGATLTPGVYCSTTATTLTGDLTLNANGNPDAIFIIKINGEFSVNSPVNIILTGSAQLKNVYWQVNGAFNLAAGATFKGTLINAGAINLASGATLLGRALSTAGAISLNNNNINITEATLPVTLISFYVTKGENQAALLNWATTSETNSDRFEIEHSATGKIWKRLAVVGSMGESRELLAYSFLDSKPMQGNNFYRLKMIDKDETFTYSRIRNINMEAGNKASLYPNPASAKLTLQVDDISTVERVEINDITGRLILDQKKIAQSVMQSDFNVDYFPAGLYLVKITHANGSFDRLRIVKK
jgi:hypothetical protein